MRYIPTWTTAWKTAAIAVFVTAFIGMAAYPAVGEGWDGFNAVGDGGSAGEYAIAPAQDDGSSLFIPKDKQEPIIVLVPIDGAFCKTPIDVINLNEALVAYVEEFPDGEFLPLLGTFNDEHGDVCIYGRSMGVFVGKADITFTRSDGADVNILKYFIPELGKKKRLGTPYVYSW